MSPRCAPRCAPWLVAGLMAFAVHGGRPRAAAAQWIELDVPPRPDPATVDVDAGRAVYEERCWFCHGEEGMGDGPVAPYLWPRPRDFTMGSFKLRTTTTGELPLDEDLFRTISIGLAGSSMPAWESVLSEEERWQVIGYIKNFAADLFGDEFFDPYQAIAEIGDQPSGRAEDLIAAGERIYDENKCWECHGMLGRGDGARVPDLTDDWDYPIWPANLHEQWKLKGGQTVEEIYLRFTTGLDGTPMPSYEATVTNEERWQLAYYIESLIPDDESESESSIIPALRVEGPLPNDSQDPAWDDVDEVKVPLTGQATYAPRWQIPAVTDVSVRVAFNEDEIAFRLAWDDRFADTLAVDSMRAFTEGYSVDDTYPVVFPDGERVRGWFADAAEIMIPVHNENTLVLPHFVYGNAGQPVDLWRWRAEHEYGAGQPAVIEMSADGADAPPEVHDADSQLAAGSGSWVEGRWTVVIRRPLRTEHATGEVQLAAGRLVPVAFHVWDGANGETGLRMSLSSWMYLDLNEPAPFTAYLGVLLAVALAVLAEWALVQWVRRGAERGRLSHFGVGTIGSSTEAT
jgi:DMSO reductase family type II enzyme heme b subunit